jgi:hypothetical protein
MTLKNTKVTPNFNDFQKNILGNQETPIYSEEDINFNDDFLKGMKSEKHHRSIDQLNHFDKLGALNIAPKDKFFEPYNNTSLGVNMRKGPGNMSFSNKLVNERSDYRIVSVISLDESILKSSRLEKKPRNKKGYKTDSSEFSKETKSRQLSKNSFHPKRDKISDVQQKAISGFVKKYEDKNFSNILDYSIINVKILTEDKIPLYKLILRRVTLETNCSHSSVKGRISITIISQFGIQKFMRK